MRWILDLELLLLISHIVWKWNRAKTFFVCSHSLPQNPFLLRQEISWERGLWLLNGNYKKMFLLLQTYLGGQSYCSPPFNPPNPVSSCHCIAGIALGNTYAADSCTIGGGGEGGDNRQNWQGSTPPLPKTVFLFSGFVFESAGSSLEKKEKEVRRQDLREGASE